MAERRKQTRGGPKTTRSEIVTIRLEPKLRYLAELAARKQRRTLSSFIEWAIETALKDVDLQERISIVDENGQATPSLRKITVADDAESLWDVEEADRFVKLASLYPELLTHDEQVLRKLIWESRLMSGELMVKLRDYIRDSEHAAKSEALYEQFKRVRMHWDTFIAIAAGEMDISALVRPQEGDPDTEPPSKTRRASKPKRDPDKT